MVRFLVALSGLLGVLVLVASVWRLALGVVRVDGGLVESGFAGLAVGGLMMVPLFGADLRRLLRRR